MSSRRPTSGLPSNPLVASPCYRQIRKFDADRRRNDVPDLHARIAKCAAFVTPPNQRKAPGRLVEGQVVANSKQALERLAVAYPDRSNPHL